MSGVLKAGLTAWVFVFMVASCSDDSSSSTAASVKCSNSITGEWTGDNKDILKLGSDELFSYTGEDGCKTSGTYSCPGEITEGSLKVTIDVAESSDFCLPAGDYVCPFDRSDDDLSFYCSNDNVTGAARDYKK